MTMVKNQHLLAGLILVGAVNLLVILFLLFGESASSRGLATTRAEQRKSTDLIRQETNDLRQQLKDAQAGIDELHQEVVSLKAELNKTRKALEAAEERLEKVAPK